VRLTLYGQGMNFDNRPLNLQEFEQHDPIYLKLNPAGVAPALVDDKPLITESSVIIEYIDDRFLEAPLVPPDPAAGARMRRWLKFSDNVAYDAGFLPKWTLLSTKSVCALNEKERSDMLSRVPANARRDRWEKVAVMASIP
jgi:glutathione S-transferase